MLRIEGLTSHYGRIQALKGVAINVEAGELVVAFEGREVVYGFGELDELVLAYAVTVHKSQGSEYPAVVIPLTTQHYPMLRRNLLYTGVTRGKQLVVLIAQPKAVAIAVKGQRQREHRRWSRLRAVLIEARTDDAHPAEASLARALPTCRQQVQPGLEAGS